MQEILNRANELGLSEFEIDRLGTLLFAPSECLLLTKLVIPETVHAIEGLPKLMFLDTETTGVNKERDEVIELGYAIMQLKTDGSLYGPVKIFNELNQPELPINNSHIHGIEDEDVLGKFINKEEVAADIAMCAAVIAHNAGFDRQMLERFIPEFKDIAWGCTYKDINWKNSGIESSKLDYIAYKLGFYYEAHRAFVDVIATIEAVKRGNAIKELIAGLKAKRLVVSAAGAPFAAKDKLKDAGYKPLYVRGKFKCWYTEVDEKDLDATVFFLKKDIGCRTVPIKEITALDRFSIREEA